ncbi:MAG TPA: phosphodiester glycosidase family protein [Chitinophagaceae bacterium]|nr:phosphodiester glycosidase family protein [Chitinophagaceae bacterium]
MKRHIVIAALKFAFFILYSSFSFAQLKWQNVDSLYQPLPSSVHVYFTNTQIDSGLFRAYYLIADLKDKKLDFTVDTSKDRRLTPLKFYERNNKPLAVVNCTFFSYETNRSVSVVVKDGKIVSHNEAVKGRGGDSLRQYYYFKGAIGIFRNRKADVAWLGTNPVLKYAIAYQSPRTRAERGKLPSENSVTYNDSSNNFNKRKINGHVDSRWKVYTAVGGGPVLVQENNIMITNNQEGMFTGKAINDKHPRTSMGYTKDGKLIILVIEGRNKQASGATLTQEARIFKDLGCWEALNLDGGGSSCLLVNGKETIKVSDAAGQRPVPAVFLIKNRD